MSKALYTIVYSAFFYCPAVAVLFQLKRFNCIVLMIIYLRCKGHFDNWFMVLYVVSVVGL